MLDKFYLTYEELTLFYHNKPLEPTHKIVFYLTYEELTLNGVKKTKGSDSRRPSFTLPMRNCRVSIHV